MRIELYGVARVRAQTECVEVEATSVREALCELARTVPSLAPEIVTTTGELGAGYLVSRNGKRFDKSAAGTLSPGDVLLLLSAQAGG